jgi:ABC-type transport system involved in cytochrome bd biosynthesis fused ATPase/permease subunit
MSTRLRLALGAAVVVLAVVGIVLAFVNIGVIAFAIIAVAAVLATSWLFYEIGASEDRDRRAGRS